MATFREFRERSITITLIARYEQEIDTKACHEVQQWKFCERHMNDFAACIWEKIVIQVNQKMVGVMNRCLTPVQSGEKAKNRETDVSWMNEWMKLASQEEVEKRGMGAQVVWMLSGSVQDAKRLW